jgi:DNA polymerase-3 subunit delta'
MTTVNPVLPWQQNDWQHLQRYVLQNRIPQALLISGNKGLGKHLLANQFAAALLCSKPHSDGTACGHCQSCMLFNAQTHPDILHIHPEEAGKNITIAQIRSLTAKLTLKPQFERYRVAIINPADQMNNAAANAFLKCLEEPNERTSIILITDKPNRLPATIISRCQKLNITPPDKTSLRTWLKQNNIHDDLEVLCNLAKNAPLLIQQYVTDQHITTRNECFKQWAAIAKRQNHPVIVAEQWLNVPESALLFWLTSWVMDLIKCVYQVKAAHLYNPDLTKPLQELAGQLELTGLYKLYDVLLLSQQRLNTQINKQLMLEEILIDWSNLNPESQPWQNKHLDKVSYPLQ